MQSLSSQSAFPSQSLSRESAHDEASSAGGAPQSAAQEQLSSPGSQVPSPH